MESNSNDNYVLVLEDRTEVKSKHPKFAVFCGYRIVATFAQKRCLH